MLPWASIWKTYSLPIRRAGSPVQRLLLAQDRIAHARGIQAGHEGAGDLLVAVVEGGRAAHPVEHSRSATASGPAAATSAASGTSNGNPFVQSMRADAGTPHGSP